ncbi:GntR family transcriptional regulator [Oceanibacterium hippocampi]|nr:GntR family transcriptional regulator [Oceanibacterium hippocampi]
MSAQQRAYAFIKDRIMSGSIQGGAKLNPVSIADQLGISRMPVREALLQLDAEGLVTNRPNRGAIVTSLTADDVEELFEIRAALEGVAARHAATRFTPSDMEELQALSMRMNRPMADVRAWLKIHDQFHDVLCSIGARPRLLNDIRKTRTSVHPYLLLYISVYNETEMEGAEHDSLLSALQTRNALLVERIVTDHILQASTGVIRFLRQRNGASPLAASATDET